MEEKSRTLLQAHAHTELGMSETARPLWLSAAVLEERIAPLLEMAQKDDEAAVHRVSAASCFQKAGEFSRAANLYRAALAGPLRPETRKEVEHLLTDCLKRLGRAERERVAS
jgi:hypothetical protein